MNAVDLDSGPTFQPVSLEAAMGPAILVRKDTTLREVARVMLERHVDSVVVVDANGAVRGVVTDRDLTLNQRNLRFATVKIPRLNGRWVTPLDAIDAACVAAMAMIAEEVMNSRLTTANVREPIGAVVDRMVRREVDYAVVLLDGGVVGLLGGRDLLWVIAGQPRSQPVPITCNGAVSRPTAHLELHRGGPQLLGWFSQVWR